MNCRIALAGLHMECATVRPQVTTREVFEAITARGRDFIETFRGSKP
jgi:microcystin degradation protein MlrC